MPIATMATIGCEVNFNRETVTKEKEKNDANKKGENETSDSSDSNRILDTQTIENNDQIKKELELESEKISFDILEKEKISASEVNLDMIKASNFDNEKFACNISQLKVNNDNESIIIAYTLIENKNKIASLPKVQIITDFKKQHINLKQLNKITQNVIIKIPNISEKFARDIAKQNIEIEGVNVAKFKVDIIDFNVTDDELKLIVNYKILDLESNLLSDLQTVELEGFKRPQVSKGELNNIAKNLKIDYASKSEVLLSNFLIDNLTWTDIENESVKVVFKSFKNRVDNTSVTVEYQIKDVNYENALSDVFTVMIYGFKVPNITVDKLQSELKKVSVKYNNKENTLASLVKNEEFVFENIDPNIQAKIVSVNKNLSKKSVALGFHLFDINNPDNTSFLKNIVINDFKTPRLTNSELNKIKNLVEFGYVNVAEVFQNAAVISDVTISNPAASSVEITLTKIAPNEDGVSVNLSYQIKDINYPENILDGETKISGFKKTPLTVDQLNSMADELEFNVNQKEKHFANSIAANNILITGYNNQRVTVEISNLSVNEDNTSLLITYHVEDISSENRSESKTKVLNGFKKSPITISGREEIIKTLEWDYPNKAQISVSDFQVTSLIVSNHDESKTTLTIESSEKNLEKASVTVFFSVADKLFPTNKTKSSAEITGFKQTKLPSEKLASLSKSIKLEYSNKENVVISDLVNGEITIRGLDERLRANVISAKTSPEDSSIALVLVEINDALYPENKIQKTLEISGFKYPQLSNEELTAYSQNIVFDYTNKTNTLVSEAAVENVTVKNVHERIQTELVELRAISSDLSKALLTLKIIDANYLDNTIEKNIIISDFKYPETSAEKLNSLAQLVIFDYPQKEKILVADTVDELISFSKYDSLNYSVLISKIIKNPTNNTISVTYTLNDLHSENKSVPTVHVISGFKVPQLTFLELQKEAKKIDTRYPSKENTLTRNFNLERLQILNLNSELVEITLLEDFELNSDNRSVNVKYNLIDKKYRLNIWQGILTVKGFKHPATSMEDLNAIANNITFDYPQKSKVVLADVETNLITVSKFDETVATLVIKNAVKKPNNTLEITYTINDMHSASISETKTKTVSGFKVPQLLQADFDSEIRKFVITYENKETISATDALTSAISVTGFDETKVSFSLNSGVSVNVNKTSISVNFTLTDKNYSTNVFSGTLQIDGFLNTTVSSNDINEVAKGISLYYNQKESVLLKDVVENQINSTDFDRNSFALNIKTVSKDFENNSITVTYSIQEKGTENVSEDVTTKISGFRVEFLKSLEFAAEAKKITFSYPNSSETLANAALKESVVATGHNEKIVELNITEVTVLENKVGIKINYELKDKNHLTNISQNSFELLGFKIPQLNTEQFNKISEKITVTYPNKENVFAGLANANGVVFSKTDSKINVENVSAKVSTGSRTDLKVMFEISDVNYPENKTTVTKTISGFKAQTTTKLDINKIAEKVVLHVENAPETPVTNVTFENMRKFGFDETLYKFIPKTLEIQANRTSLLVTFNLKTIDETVSSIDKTYLIENLKFVKPVALAHVRPANIFANSQPVVNDKYDVTIESSQAVFDYKENKANSYRIPSALTLQNGHIILGADKRIKNSDDSGGPIEQVLKRSTDGGKTYGPMEQVVKISKPKTNNGLTIDGVFGEVLVDKNDPSKGNKIIHMFSVFPGYAGINETKNGTPFHGEAHWPQWKAWVRSKPGKEFDSEGYIFIKTDRPGWWRLRKITDGTKRDFYNSATKYMDTKTYVDVSYDPIHRSISGQIFENVESSDFYNPTKLKTRATTHSIFDPSTDKNSKYAVSFNNHNFQIESFDNGKTWTNAQLVGTSWRQYEYAHRKFIGNGVGNGIQLKNQKDPSLNGRIIFPYYIVTETSKEAAYLASDDNGKTWDRLNSVNWREESQKGKFNNLSESSMVQTADGTLYWLLRNSRNTQRISKSTDGGITWTNPIDPKSADVTASVGGNLDGDLFTGLTHFNIKGEDYFVFASPKSNDNRRHNGGLYITKDWKNIDLIWSFDTRGEEHFIYSYPTTVEVGENYADIVLAYEWSKKADPFGRKSLPKGVAITADKFRIIIK